MKKTLILTSMFSNDLMENYKKVLKLNEETAECVVLSPVSIVNNDKDRYLQTVAAALNMKDLIVAAEETGKDILYVGPAIKGVVFDNIYTVNKKTIKSQEDMLDAFVKGSPMVELLTKFYRTEDAIKDFNSMEELLAHRKENN